MKGIKNTLSVCAIVFLPSFIFAVLPWQVLIDWFTQYEIQIPADPFTAFCARMLYAIFGMVGVFFIILARESINMSHPGMCLRDSFFTI